MTGLRTGYPGLTHTAKQIAELIGACDVFVEPFAGLGRVSKFINANQIVLNDMSDFAVEHLRTNFPQAKVTQKDFLEVMRECDASNVTFFCDPPWSRSDYALNPKTYCDRGVGEYYKQLREFVNTCKGRWFIAGRASGGARATATVYFKEYEMRTVVSDRTINGYPVKTLLVSKYFNLMPSSKNRN